MIEFIGVTRSTKVERAIERGLNAMGASGTSVYVVEDFSRVVAELTGDLTYQASKLDGSSAAARTVVHGGRPVIVLSTLAVASGLRMLERVAAHEAGHVLMRRRDECNDEMSGGSREILRGLRKLESRSTGVNER